MAHSEIVNLSVKIFLQGSIASKQENWLFDAKRLFPLAQRNKDIKDHYLYCLVDEGVCVSPTLGPVSSHPVEKHYTCKCLHIDCT